MAFAVCGGVGSGCGRGPQADRCRRCTRKKGVARRRATVLAAARRGDGEGGKGSWRISSETDFWMEEDAVRGQLGRRWDGGLEEKRRAEPEGASREEGGSNLRGSKSKQAEAESLFNTIIVFGSVLVLAFSGLGTPVAKKLLLSSLTLPSMSGLGALWVTRNLMEGRKFQPRIKKILVSDSMSTMESMVRKALVAGSAGVRERQLQPRDPQERTESYFPFITEEEAPKTLPLTPESGTASETDFAEWGQ